MENVIFCTICTVTTVRWFFLKISRPLSPSSSALAGRITHATNTAAAAAGFDISLMSFLFGWWSILPVRLQFQKRCVDAAFDFHYHNAGFASGDLFHFPAQCVHIVHRLAIYFQNQIAHVKRTELGPTAGFDILDQRAALVGRPAPLSGIEEGHVARR